LKVADIGKAAVNIAKGLGVTFGEQLKKPITNFYPDTPATVKDGYRGVPVLVQLPTGEFTCTACMACVRACPIGIIQLDTVMVDRKRAMDEFRLEVGRCLQCNLCVESCNFDALVMAPEFELASYTREPLVLYKNDLAKLYAKYFWPKEGEEHHFPARVTSKHHAPGTGTGKPRGPRAAKIAESGATITPGGGGGEPAGKTPVGASVPAESAREAATQPQDTGSQKAGEGA